MKISVIIPSYNAEGKIGRCLRSLDALEFDSSEIEVIFVDDASTDATAEILRNACRKNRNWHLIRMEANSGSPSRPRNIGTDAATGEYVFFLDCDDELVRGALQVQYDLAVKHDLDLVRASLIVDETGRGRRIMNRIPDFNAAVNHAAKVEMILRHQSTTNSSLIRLEFLRRHAILWPENLHMGEDTVFLISVMIKTAQIGYVDSPGIVYNRQVSDAKSTTQSYGARELDSHLTVWSFAERNLRELGISYMAIRGQTAVKFAIESMHRFYAGSISIDQFSMLAAFISEHSGVTDAYEFSPRVLGTYRLIQQDLYADFLEDIKPRMVIAGSDLKFILDAVPALERYFQIRVDAWAGHDSHDERRSRELLDWAEIIWCEWLLGNAVWYAHNKKWNQKLVVRMHLFEMTRDFGHHIDATKVDCFFSVSVPTTEDMIRTFGFDRAKVRVIPNYVDVESYRASEDPDRVFRLAMVGILPRRKGYRKALELLNALCHVDSRYSLTVFGKMPEELPWVYRDSAERAYYEECNDYIRRSNLSDKVRTGGWVDTKESIADFGYVLSLSDFESFHVAPAEAFAAGNQALFLPWPGVDYIYPEEYVVRDIFELRDRILKGRVLEEFKTTAESGNAYVRKNYDLPEFVGSVRRMVAEI